MKPGGAYPGDIYVAPGRWRERLAPPNPSSFDDTPLTVGRSGLASALSRLRGALYPMVAPGQSRTQQQSDQALLSAVTATYDALEWVHSLDEHLRVSGRYTTALSEDPTCGGFVEGAIGARNASHHGLRRVVGFVDVPSPKYVAEGRRWTHTGEYDSTWSVAQVRWVSQLPLRTEPKETGKSALRWTKQEQSFIEHLAGRDVRNTFNALTAFFFYALDGKPLPSDLFFGPATSPPPIDPDSLSI